MEILRDDLSGPEVAEFLAEHLAEMRRTSPPESTHALDLDGLRHPSVTFWTVRDGDLLVGCGALKALGPRHGEIKSMRTRPARTRRGTGSALLAHIIDVARARSYRELLLETGAADHFAPARRLYRRYGFVATGPYGDYPDDPHSVHLRLEL